MSQKKQLTIKEFARLTGIRRENLRFYDRIGLLCPEMRGENNYRYYSRRQLNAAYLISDLRGLGVGIEAIKAHAANSTPENTLDLLARQDAHIEAEIRRLRETRRVMQLHKTLLQEALAHGENALFLEEKAPEPIFLCPEIPPGMDEEEAGIFSYDYAEAHGVNLGIPYGILVPKEALGPGLLTGAERYYFKVGKDGNAFKPAGLYAVACGKVPSWRPDALYLRLMELIHHKGLCICGDAYEEYPLGSLAQLEDGRHLFRVEVPVAPNE